MCSQNHCITLKYLRWKWDYSSWYTLYFPKASQAAWRQCTWWRSLLRADAVLLALSIRSPSLLVTGFHYSSHCHRFLMRFWQRNCSLFNKGPRHRRALAFRLCTTRSACAAYDFNLAVDAEKSSLWAHVETRSTGRHALHTPPHATRAPAVHLRGVVARGRLHVGRSKCSLEYIVRT